jgi:NAD(P)-dependent dehydrogenase (short-subunit alcohol dehydrogenase family)
MAVNVNGPFYATRAVIPYFLKNTPVAGPNAPPSFSMAGEQLAPVPPSKGTIVNICSIASLGGGSAGTPYTVSKHALLGLTRSTAYMHQADGIRCNAVMPGATATNIAKNSAVQINPEGEGFQRTRKFAALMPVIRTPDVISSAVVWLAGAEHVTGAEIVVDGGWRAGL